MQLYKQLLQVAILPINLTGDLDMQMFANSYPASSGIGFLTNNYANKFCNLRCLHINWADYLGLQIFA